MSTVRTREGCTVTTTEAGDHTIIELSTTTVLELAKEDKAKDWESGYYRTIEPKKRPRMPWRK